MSLPHGQRWTGNSQICYSATLVCYSKGTTQTHLKPFRAFYCKAWGNPWQRYARKNYPEYEEGRRNQSFTTCRLSSTSLKLHSLSCEWQLVELNQITLKGISCLLPSRKPSAVQEPIPDIFNSHTVASTRLIEAHLALDLTIWAWVCGNNSSPSLLTLRLIAVSVQWLNRYIH